MQVKEVNKKPARLPSKGSATGRSMNRSSRRTWVCLPPNSIYGYRPQLRAQLRPAPSHSSPIYRLTPNVTPLSRSFFSYCYHRCSRLCWFSHASFISSTVCFFWSLVNIFWVGVLTHPNQQHAVCCHPKEERKKNETNAVDLPAQKKNDHQQKSEKKRKENLMCLYTLSPLAPFIH